MDFSSIDGLDNLISDAEEYSREQFSMNSGDTMEVLTKVSSTLNNNYGNELIIFTSLINDDWSNDVHGDSYFDAINKGKQTGVTVQGMLDVYLIFDLEMLENRIPYQVIAQITYEMDKLGLFKDNFQTQKDRMDYNLERFKTQYNPSNKFDSYATKIISHFELSFVQSRFIRESVEDVTKQAKEAEKKLENIKATKGQIYTEFVSILGIFSALMFGLFGSFEGLSTSIGKIADGYDLGKTIMASAALFISITVLTYSLIKWISQLIDKPINSCKCVSDEVCNHSFVEQNKSFIIILLLELLLLLTGVLIFSSKITGLTSWLSTGIGAYVLIISLLVTIGIVFVQLLKLIYKRKK